MLQVQLPRPVKFICGFIYTEEEIYAAAKASLVKGFGDIDYESRRIDFNFTDYYKAEMGEPLFRRFVAFKKLQDTCRFVFIKLFCIKLEKRFAVSDRRRINLDPGYLNEAKLVLLTTKDFSHRIHLGKGIYAEVTLHFKSGTFSEFSFTFPDFRTPLYKDIFKQIRDIYKTNISRHGQR